MIVSQLFVPLFQLSFIVCLLPNIESKLYTKQIDPNLIARSSLPTDTTSVIGAEVLLNANKYCLGKWFASKGFDNKSQYFDFHGKDENHIRGPSAQSLGLATSLMTKLYNESVVKMSEKEAINLTVKLVASLAYRHKANTANGWGDEWQSALWTGYAGLAAWLMWPHIAESDRTLIENMVIHEANRFLTYKVPYYQDRDLKVITPGDTKAEENAWNAQVVQLALAMMPDHPNWKPWMRKNIELIVSAFSRHSDLNRTDLINGKKINEWINGSNVFENGTLVNHNIIHPDYIVTVNMNLNYVIHAALARQSVPLATFWNAELMYSALVNLKWPNKDPKLAAHEIYERDSSGKATSTIFYPNGDDWGNSRKMNFAIMDSHIDKLTGFGNKYNASQWSALHIEAQLKLQQRFTDGRTYGDPKEDTYPLREEWVSSLGGYNYLGHWVKHNLNYTVTNAKLD